MSDRIITLEGIGRVIIVTDSDEAMDELMERFNLADDERFVGGPEQWFRAVQKRIVDAEKRSNALELQAAACGEEYNVRIARIERADKERDKQLDELRGLQEELNGRYKRERQEIMDRIAKQDKLLGQIIKMLPGTDVPLV
jgi:hypothetical protein